MARRRRLPPTDAMFLYGETPRSMMHVASLMPFTPPEGAGPTYLRDLVDRLVARPVQEPFNLKLSHPGMLTHPLQSWVEDEEFDITYHVRRSALASPGDERELGILVSRLHSHQLDLTRPPWEIHVIEGLSGGRFAVYSKMHHALIDGHTGIRMLERSLSSEPDPDAGELFHSVPAPERPGPEEQSRTVVQQLAGAARGARDAAGATGSLAARLWNLELGRGGPELVTGHEAPPTILNRPTGRNRRFATQQYDTERLREIGLQVGGTINDVLLAVFGAALRRFLLEQQALPEDPLVAFVPISMRQPDDVGGGNKVAATLVSLGTHLADPLEQLRSVISSTQEAKSQVRGLGHTATLAYTGYLFAPALVQAAAAVAGVPNPIPTTFNVCISNVRGPRETLYLAGSRLEAVYPVSIPTHGMALNITVESYAGTMNVGFVGCRDAVPSLQRLAVHSGEALADLEAAVQQVTVAREEAQTSARARVERAATRKTAGKQPAGRKTTGKRTTGKKTTGKRTTGKKTAGTKAAAKTAAGKKAAGKTATSTKAATESPTMKAAPKKSATKKAAPKKATKKAATKQAATKKAATKKSPAARKAPATKQTGARSSTTTKGPSRRSG